MEEPSLGWSDQSDWQQRDREKVYGEEKIRLTRETDRLSRCQL